MKRPKNGDIGNSLNTDAETTKTVSKSNSTQHEKGNKKDKPTKTKDTKSLPDKNKTMNSTRSRLEPKEIDETKYKEFITKNKQR